MRTEKEGISGANEVIIAGMLQRRNTDWAALKSAGFDPGSLWERVDGDPELLRDLLEVFKEEFPPMLAGLEHAIQNGDATGLERSAHKIKGSMLQFSGHGAAAAALQLEELGRNGTVAGAGIALQRLKQETEILMKTLHTMIETGTV
jgi:HPt (histidine-containing phosphotransfer) domain-containing protein